MKKFYLSSVSLVLILGLFSMAEADINSVTPSTNDINKTKGWAYVEQLSKGVGSTDLQFVSTRSFYSCFEYRTDGDTSQKTSDTNFNADITDGLYPYVCVNNSTSLRTITAQNYVEVRMVFGAERDERFDWTRFDVIYPRTAEITAPSAGEVVSGLVNFSAVLDDKDKDDGVQWAVRKGTCAAGTGTVLGDVDGRNDPFTWDKTNFNAQADVSGWDEGDYCFVFNPTESSGDLPIRLTREFVVEHPAEIPAHKNQCKNGGWKDLADDNGGPFKNQGDCVSFVATGGKNKAAGN